MSESVEFAAGSPPLLPDDILQPFWTKRRHEESAPRQATNPRSIGCEHLSSCALRLLLLLRNQVHGGGGGGGVEGGGEPVNHLPSGGPLIICNRAAMEILTALISGLEGD